MNFLCLSETKHLAVAAGPSAFFTGFVASVARLIGSIDVPGCIAVWLKSGISN